MLLANKQYTQCGLSRVSVQCLSDIKKDKTNQIDFLLIRKVVKSRNYAVNSSKIITDAGCVAVCATIVLPEKTGSKLEKNQFFG